MEYGDLVNCGDGVSFELNADLLDTFVRHLEDVRNGSVAEDVDWADQQIHRAESMDPDLAELKLFVLCDVGVFTGSNGRDALGWERAMETPTS